MQLQLCDSFFFLGDAAAAGGGLSGAQLTNGSVGLGASWPSADTFAASFSGGRPDGAAPGTAVPAGGIVPAHRIVLAYLRS